PNVLATVQQDLERRLKALQIQLIQVTDAKKVAEKEKKYASKYKMIKFIEKQKISRKITKLRKILQKSNISEADSLSDHENESDSDSPSYPTSTPESILQQIDSLETQLEYIKHFPVDMKYIALFTNKSNADSDDNEEEDSEKEDDGKTKSDMLRDKIMQTIKEAVKAGKHNKKGFILREADIFPEKKKTFVEEDMVSHKKYVNRDDEGLSEKSKKKIKNNDDFFL
ncbi:hypothetical protein HK096_009949, partial [Nowakowskiella sp. JEL0078]